MSIRSLSLAAVAAGLALSACSAKVSGDGGAIPAPPQFMDPKPTIQGPAVSGHWVSQCHVKPGTTAYRRFDVTFTPTTVNRNELLFSDAQCTTSAGANKASGRYRFIDHYADDSYVIEYGFDLGQGLTSFPQEKVQLVNGQLLLSDFAIGEIAPMLTDEPLSNANAPTPTPTPTPTPAPTGPQAAVPATNYSEAKYAFCSNQGSGVMLDLSSVDLSQNGSGDVRTATKVCGDTAALQWSRGTSHINVTMNGGLPQIDFPNSQFGDYVHADQSHTGLSGSMSAYSVLGGNSGECFFLKNEGTTGLPFVFDCE